MNGLKFAQLGDVIKRGFDLLLANPVIFLPAAISVLVQGYLSSRLLGATLGPVVWSELILYFGLMMLFSFLGAVILIKMSRDALAGKADLGVAMSLSASKLLPVAGAGLLYMAAIMVGGLLLVVPGLIIAVKLMFLFHLIVLEDYGVTEAFSVAWKMTDGRWWWVLALLVIGGLLTGLASTVIAFLPTGMQVVAKLTYDLFYQSLGVTTLTCAFVLLREIDAQ